MVVTLRAGRGCRLSTTVDQGWNSLKSLGGALNPPSSGSSKASGETPKQPSSTGQPVAGLVK
jgi:hypothetical protein